jgi:hypothetical protein
MNEERGTTYDFPDWIVLFAGRTLLCDSRDGRGTLWLVVALGILTAAVLIPVARFGPRGFWAQMGVIFLLLVVVGLGCTLSEGVVFFPETKAQMLLAIPGGTVIYLIAAAMLAALGKLLKLSDNREFNVAHRPAVAVGPLVLVSAVSYVVYYLVFGGITFQFFTRHFYPHATEQVAAMGSWFWGYQLARGLLMTLAVVPIIYTLRLPRWKTALIAGLLVWIVGGGAPLLVPNTMMIATQRYMHIVEIMTQNVSLGITAAYLLLPRTRTAMRSMQIAPTT